MPETSVRYRAETVLAKRVEPQSGERGVRAERGALRSQCASQPPASQKMHQGAAQGALSAAGHFLCVTSGSLPIGDAQTETLNVLNVEITYRSGDGLPWAEKWPSGCDIKGGVGWEILAK